MAKHEFDLVYEEPPVEPNKQTMAPADYTVAMSERKAWNQKREAQAKLSKYEIAALISLWPRSVEEAESLLPTLKRFSDRDQMQQVIVALSSAK